MKRVMFLSGVLFLVIGVGSVFGDSTAAEAMPWQGGLDNIANALRGPTAKTIGLIMIVGAGLFMAFAETQGIKKVLFIVVGLGIALNAQGFIDNIIGDGEADGALVPRVLVDYTDQSPAMGSPDNSVFDADVGATRDRRE